MGLLVRRSIRDMCSSNSKAGHQKLFERGILHRDISIGNVLITEDETKGFLIDLDHAIRINRNENSGENGRTGTKVFMSIGLLLQKDDQCRPHSFMDDFESMFWLLFWICVHYSGPDGTRVKSTPYEAWDFLSPTELGFLKTGTISNELDFLNIVRENFSDFYQPLVPWVNRVRTEVFPGGKRWKHEDRNLYERMKDVLRAAMEDPLVMAGSPEPPAIRHNHQTQ
jgi:serine/threonine protein kinase